MSKPIVNTTDRRPISSLKVGDIIVGVQWHAGRDVSAGEHVWGLSMSIYDEYERIPMRGKIVELHRTRVYIEPYKNEHSLQDVFEKITRNCGGVATVVEGSIALEPKSKASQREQQLDQLQTTLSIREADLNLWAQCLQKAYDDLPQAKRPIGFHEK